MKCAALLVLVSIAQCLPAQSPISSPPACGDLETVFEAYRKTLLDWGGMTRYGSANTELPPAEADRVVFLGDEITERWGQSKEGFFPGKPYLNRGITRQTTAQMLVRFRQDVIDLNPRVVVIEAGMNDLASVMGPSSQGNMAEQFMSMTDLAKAHGIRIVIASVTPVCNCYREQTTLRPPGKIAALNAWLKEFALENGFVYLDYYSVLVQGRLLKKDLTSDGLVPNDAGYALMAPLTEKAIAQALARP